MREPGQDPDASYRRLLQGNENIIIRVHVKSVWDEVTEVTIIAGLVLYKAASLATSKVPVVLDPATKHSLQG